MIVHKIMLLPCFVRWGVTFPHWLFIFLFRHCISTAHYIQCRCCWRPDL